MLKLIGLVYYLFLAYTVKDIRCAWYVDCSYNRGLKLGSEGSLYEYEYRVECTVKKVNERRKGGRYGKEKSRSKK